MFRVFVVTIAFMVYGCEGIWLYGFHTNLDVVIPRAKVVPVSKELREPRVNFTSKTN